MSAWEPVVYPRGYDHARGCSRTHPVTFPCDKGTPTMAALAERGFLRTTELLDDVEALCEDTGIAAITLDDLCSVVAAIREGVR